MATHDLFSGKPRDRASDNLPKLLAERCEDCGSHLINRCLRCGAPVCCPQCCADEEGGDD